MGVPFISFLTSWDLDQMYHYFLVKVLIKLVFLFFYWTIAVRFNKSYIHSFKYGDSAITENARSRLQLNQNEKINCKRGRPGRATKHNEVQQKRGIIETKKAADR